ncbi:11389_t:CDS:1 [Paraglomus brasilianum]|uniref:11389_t:CDS:1 n=1 Tax=Paraglomus brasilianum TaxID=144538 RepID=A0A9N9AXN2_9GLOM|nr:11389_t:CDS:1 [Paraglomus brasilianum]
MNGSKLTREEYCSKYLEVAYQNCLSMLNRNDLAEINSFYQIQTLNYYEGKIENIEELREKITEAYNTLKDPRKRKEYEFEIFGIFCREYPEDEVADKKFKERAIWLLEEDEK